MKTMSTHANGCTIRTDAVAITHVAQASSITSRYSADSENAEHTAEADVRLLSALHPLTVKSTHSA